MLTLGLAFTLLTAPPLPEPSARLLFPDEVAALQAELRATELSIKRLRPVIPKGFVAGMSLGFSFAVLLLPGIPLLVGGLTSSGFIAATLSAIGGVLTTFGGVALVVGLLCAVLGTNVEAELQAKRAQLVERRDALKTALEQARPPSPETSPGWVPGVRREAPAVLFVLARF